MMKRRRRASKRVKMTSVNEHTTHTQQKTHDDTGGASSEFCRLCHGRFSTRRLRQAFTQLQGDSCRVYPLFSTDFQQLLGIPMNRDPRLSQYICNRCHAQFYKCHSILLDFSNRVNLTPRDKVNTTHSSAREDITLFTPSSSPHITSDRRCLYSLVSWAHSHAEGCRSCPDLQEVLEGQFGGTLRLMWGCVDGHTYVMNTSAGLKAAEQTGVIHENQQSTSEHDVPARTDTEVQRCEKIVMMDTHDDDDADSELSDRNCLSEDEECEEQRKTVSSEESSDVNTDTCSLEKNNRKEHKTLETKVRRKPGPKPGWKKNIKAEREELPTIYKCPHQGCTAVYRGADGMKKHIKEHHEEVRERPCPHPGCNKVFMIDRYLQRHVKLIHTEVRNYICDECGQTFKQRKHLSVHQMRHSGAKPLQCEVCGFQCRQRASLKYHMTKHKAEADLEFACAICAKRFEKAHNLNVHMSMVHPLLQGGSISIPLDSSAQQTDFRPQQKDSVTSDMNCALENINAV